MKYIIYFRTDEFYGLTRYILKGEITKDFFGNISILSVILTIITFPLFLFLDTFILPFLILHSIFIRKKDKRDLDYEKLTGEKKNFRIL